MGRGLGEGPAHDGEGKSVYGAKDGSRAPAGAGDRRAGGALQGQLVPEEPPDARDGHGGEDLPGPGERVQRRGIASEQGAPASEAEVLRAEEARAARSRTRAPRGQDQDPTESSAPPIRRRRFLLVEPRAPL